MATRTSRWPVPTWLGLLLAAYIVLPLVLFLARPPHVGGTGPGVPGLGAALAISAETATVATAVIALLGVPLAYLLARGRSRLLGVLGIAVQLPIALPPLMSGLLLLAVLGPYTPIGELFGGRLTDDRAGIVLAQIFVSAPFLVIAAKSAFAALDPDLDDVAATLGHGPFARFLRIWVAGASRGILAGLLLAWLRGFGEFGATVVLAYHPYSLPVFTYVQFSAAGLTATNSAVRVTLAAAVIVIVVAALAAGTPRGRLRLRRRTQRPPAPMAPRVGNSPLLRFDVAARQGEFRAELSVVEGTRRLAILGPSGAGKTMVLRTLAGLLPAEREAIQVGDATISGLRPETRGVGYVPQHSTLLPGLDVWRQVNLGVDAHPGLAAHWLDRLGLAGLADRRPDQLSGGQQRRVAIARALARDPRLLLLDEPFTGLDTPTRAALQRDLRALQRQAPVGTVIVTHDPQDAALLGDEVVVLASGLAIQSGSFGDLRRAPADPLVGEILGLPNVASAVVSAPCRLRWSTIDLPASTGSTPVGAPVHWHLPAEAVVLGRGEITAEVTEVVDWGDHCEVGLRLGPGAILTASTRSAAPPPGTTCPISWDPGDVVVWPARTDPPGERSGAEVKQAVPAG